MACTEATLRKQQQIPAVSVMCCLPEVFHLRLIRLWVAPREGSDVELIGPDPFDSFWLIDKLVNSLNDMLQPMWRLLIAHPGSS